MFSTTNTRARLAVIAGAIAAIAACSKDSTSTTGTIGTGTDTSRTSAAGLNIAVDSGFFDRTAVSGTSLQANVHVTRVGVGVGGITVTWTATFGHGTPSPVTSVTDANGLATTTWTLGDTNALNILNAGITGAQVTMQATGISGAATSLTKITADSSVVVSGASTLFTARVVDRFGNPVSGIPIAWSTTSGLLTPMADTTGVSGNAQAVFTTNAAPTTYTITATSAVGAVTFKLVGL